MLNKYPVVAVLAVTDVDRARKFYEGVLGLTVQREGEDGISYECGGGTGLLVYPSQFAGTNQATAAGWSVDDLDAVMADLRGRGVTFEEYDLPGLKTENGVASFPGGRGCWFKDPDGNILALDESTG